MTNKKTKYILSSAAVSAVGIASLFGAFNLISNVIPSALAEEDLPHCTNVQRIERWDGGTTTISSPINITEDEIASYDIPNQTERCKVEINLNEHTVSEAYYNQHDLRRSLTVGKNAVVTVNGNGGRFAIGTPEDPCYDYGGEMICSASEPNLGGSETNAIEVSETGELILNDITVESRGYGVYSSGKVEANNVSIGYMKNGGGELTINGGTYQNVIVGHNGTNTINGGNITSLLSESGSNLIINDVNLASNGSIKSYEQLPIFFVAILNYTVGSKTNDITINGGNFENAKILSAATITGGNFNNTTFEYNQMDDGYISSDPIVLEESNISGGSFKNSTISLNSNISGGTFKNTSLENDEITVSGGNFDTIPATDTISSDKKVIENDDGTYSVVDESTPGEEPIQPCEIRVYTDENNYTTFTGVINLTEDTVASYEVDDQSNTCRFIINLNGNKLTSVENKEAISVGSNVSAKINGDDGKIEQSNTESTQESPAPAAIIVKDDGAASIKDVTIETKNDDAPAVSNSGRTTLSNVTAGENSNIENTDNGNLTIKSGNYDEVLSTNSGNTVIEGGTIESITTDDSSSVTVNNGTVNNITVNNDSGATINDGDFKDSNISSGDTGNNNVTVNGGDFTNAEVSSNNTTITGGDFSGTTVSGNSEISGGNFNNATVSGNSEISGGSFDNATVSGDDTTITGGTFRSTDISDNTTVTGGNFDVAPTVPEGSETVHNEDGTVTIVTTNNNTDNTDNTDNTSNTDEAASEENKLEVPNTGAMLAKELGNREMAIGIVLATETVILAVCSYILHRIKKAYRIRFNR